MWRQSVGFVGGVRGVETWVGGECVSTRARAAPTWGRKTCGFIGILVPKYPWGPKISMGGGPISGEICSHCPMTDFGSCALPRIGPAFIISTGSRPKRPLGVWFPTAFLGRLSFEKKTPQMSGFAFPPPKSGGLKSITIHPPVGRV